LDVDKSVDMERKRSTNRYGDEGIWGFNEESYRYHAIEREYDEFPRE